MDFEPTEQQTMFRKMAREFAHREIAPTAQKDDLNEHFRPDVIGKMASLGLLTGPGPRDNEGLGIDHISYAIVCEEIASASASVFMAALAVHVSLFQLSLLRWGNEEQKQEYLPGAKTGRLLSCFAVGKSEGESSPGAGIEAAPAGSGWVLRGEKTWVVNGGVADVAVVFARPRENAGHGGIAAFLAHKGTPGFSTEDVHDKLGLRASNIAQLVFNDCRLPAESLVGKIHDGSSIASHALDNEALSTAAACVGIAQTCADASVKYAQERQQFGRAIGKFELVQHMIADMIIETEAARLLVYHLGHSMDRGIPVARQAAMARAYTTAAALHASSSGIEIHGAYGISPDYGMEQRYRDAMSLSVYLGAAQERKLAVAREALG